MNTKPSSCAPDWVSCPATLCAIELTFTSTQAAFSDFSAYFVLTEESLAALNENLAEKVTMERFRPNIVITGSPAAFDEVGYGHTGE